MCAYVDRGLNVLALDGGGVRGLSQLLILEAIMERLGNYPGTDNLVKPHQVFDLICGTSAGGLSALMLGRLQMSISQCIESYKEIMKKAFESRMNKLVYIEAFDEKAFEDEMKRLVCYHGDAAQETERFLDCRPSACKVFVSTTLIATADDRQPHRFRTYSVDDLSADVEIWQAARATTAVPAYFKSIKIQMTQGGRSEGFEDGGIDGTNPSHEAYLEVFDVLATVKPRFNCFVSIGTGAAPTAAAPSLNMEYTWFPIHWINDLEEAAAKSFRTHQTMLELFRDQQDVYHRLEAPGMQEVGLEEWNMIDHMQVHISNYVNKDLRTRGRVQDIAARLARKLGTTVSVSQDTPHIPLSPTMNHTGDGLLKLSHHGSSAKSGSREKSPRILEQTKRSHDSARRVNELPGSHNGPQHQSRRGQHRIRRRQPSSANLFMRRDSRHVLQRTSTSHVDVTTSNTPTMDRSSTAPSRIDRPSSTRLQPDQSAAGNMLLTAVLEETDEYANLKSGDAILQQSVRFPQGLSEAVRTFVRDTGVTAHSLKNSISIEEQDQTRKEQMRLHLKSEKQRRAALESDYLGHLLPEPQSPDSLFRIKDRKATACDKTGGWIMQNPEYSTWSTQLEPQILMISGSPGQGKSVLAKNIAFHLRQVHESTLVVEVFCEDSLRYNTSIYIVKSILHQILQAHRRFFIHVWRSEPHQSGSKDTNPFQTYWKILLDILSDSSMPDIYCVVDGIDECQANSQDEFLHSLYSTLQSSEASDRIMARRGRFLVTSRETAVAHQYCRHGNHIKIQAENTRQDIIVYARREFNKFRAVVGNDDWADMTAMILADHSGGMFLWVSLVLEEIRRAGGSLSLKRIKESAHAGQDRLSGLYVNILSRIPCERVAEARKILEILLFSRFPLSITEFDFAMTFLGADQISQNLLQENRGNSFGFIAKELCGSLIEITAGNIGFNHHSIRQFLLHGPKLRNFPSEFVFDAKQAHLKRLSLCLKYLLMEDIELDRHKDSCVVNTRRSPYIVEAMVAWPHHLREAGDTIQEIMPLLKLFFSNSQVVDSLRTIRSFDEYFQEEQLHRSRILLEAILQFGLVNVLRLTAFCPDIDRAVSTPVDKLLHLPESILNFASPSGFGVLSTAIIAGKSHGNGITMVEELLSRGLKPECSPHGIEPLLVSAAVGKLEVLKLMLQHVPEVDYPDTDGTTALMIACQDGHAHVVDYLLKQHHAAVDRGDADNWTSLHYAAAAGHAEVVRSLLRAGASTQSFTAQGYLPLHYACGEGHVDAAQALLFKRADVNALGANKCTALHLAAARGHIRTCDLLLKWGAAAGMQTSERWTPLHQAVLAENEAVVKMILEKDKSTVQSAGGPNDETALHMAAHCPNSNIAKLLLNAGADVDPVSGEAKTPLHIAACCGNLQLVKLLKQRGADLDFEARDVIPMLHVAIYAEHTEVAKYLINNGAPCDVSWRTHYTPAFVAAWKNQPEILDLLMEKKVNMNISNRDGKSILHFLAEHGLDNFLVPLLEKGLRPDLATKSGSTTLCFAAAGGHLSTVKLLLKFRAPLNPTAKTRAASPLLESIMHKRKEVTEFLLSCSADVEKTAGDGYSVMHAAAHSDLPELIRRFCDDYHLSIDAVTQDGWQPIHLAAMKGNIRSLEELLWRRADPCARTKDGQTPLHLACGKNCHAIVKILIGAGATADCQSNSGETPISLAASTRDTEPLIRLLYENGGSNTINTQNRYGRTALHYAACMGNLQNVQLLLSMGGNPNHFDCYQFTPLDEAAGNNDLAMVKALIAAGARVDHLDGFCRSALSCLREAGIDITQEFPGIEEPLLPDRAARRTQIASVADTARRKLCDGELMNDPFSVFILGHCLGILGDLEGSAICREQQVWYSDGEARHSTVCDFGGHEVIGKLMSCRTCSNQDFCFEHYEEYKEKNLKIRGCQGHDFIQVPRDIASSLEPGQVNEQGQDLRTWLESLQFD